MSITLAPLSIMVGTLAKTAQTNTTDIRGVLIANKSPYDCQIGQIGKNGPRWLGAGSVDFWQIDRDNQLQISALAFNNAGITPAYASILLITLYYLAEPLPGGSYPAAIQIQGTQQQMSFQTITTTPSISTQILTFVPLSSTQAIYFSGLDVSTTAGSVAGTVSLSISNINNPGITFNLFSPEFIFANTINAGSGIGVIFQKTFTPLIAGQTNGQPMLSIAGTTNGSVTVCVYFFSA